MTVQQLLDWMDTVRPSAYTPEQKAAWASDLEAIIWSQIFLQPISLWRPYAPEVDMGRRLLLPDGWRRVYTAYMGAMIDLANGEYTQYENSMSLYDRCVSELGAWYADSFEPAKNAAGWLGLGTHACADLAAGRSLVTLPKGAAVLAVQYGLTAPAGGRLILRVGSGEMPDKVYITNEYGTLARTLGLALTAGAGETVSLQYEGDSDAPGTAAVQILIQPAVNKFT